MKVALPSLEYAHKIAGVFELGGHVVGEYSQYIEEPKPFLWFPIVYHSHFGIGQAKQYRDVFWHVQWTRGDITWINKRALKILAF